MYETHKKPNYALRVTRLMKMRSRVFVDAGNRLASLGQGYVGLVRSQTVYT